eukprot:g80538.t1
MLQYYRSWDKIEEKILEYREFLPVWINHSPFGTDVSLWSRKKKDTSTNNLFMLISLLNPHILLALVICMYLSLFYRSSHKHDKTGNSHFCVGTSIVKHRFVLSKSHSISCFSLQDE